MTTRANEGGTVVDKRNWMAALAMQAMTSRESTPDFLPDVDGMAEEAFRRADAMLRASERIPQELVEVPPPAQAPLTDDDIPF